MHAFVFAETHAFPAGAAMILTLKRVRAGSGDRTRGVVTALFLLFTCARVVVVVTMVAVSLMLLVVLFSSVHAFTTLMVVFPSPPGSFVAQVRR